MTISVGIRRWACLGLLVTMMMSCGGGTGGTGSPVVASGTVAGFGSVVVNGITFDTSGAAIMVNGQNGSEADLSLGQVVTVQGTLDANGATGTAATVVFENSAEGPIDSLTPATRSLVVLGQIVVVDEATQFGDASFSDLTIGNIVALSGFVDANGVLRATRVDRTQDAFLPGTEIETRGTIANLNEATQTFTLNRLTIDFSAAQLVNVPESELRNGQVVEVASRQNVMAGVLVADRVEAREVGIQGAVGEKAEIEGIVFSATAAGVVVVNGQPVRLTPDTIFEGGTVDDITVNARVEVEGTFGEDGILVVEEVEFIEAGQIELEGQISRVLSADTFEVSGQRVRYTPDTVLSMGTAADLVVGTQLQIEGFFDAAGVLVATEIEFFVDIEGLITRVSSADSFEVDGQPVRITPDTVFEDGTAADIAVAVRVEVEGRYDASGVLVALAISFL